MSTPQTTCQLGDYKFRYNGPKQVSYFPKSVTYTPCIQGGYFTDFGIVESDATIEITFPVCPADIFDGINPEYQKPGFLPFTDWAGAQWMVKFMDYRPTDGVVPAGVDAYFNVTLKLQIMSAVAPITS